MPEGFGVIDADGFDVGDEQVENEGCGGGDDKFAEEHDNPADSTDYGEPQRVGPYQFKPVFGGVAEIFASQGDLDVCLGVDELDDAFDTGKAALDTFQHIFHALISRAFRLSFEQFHHHLQELDNSHEQRTEGEGTPMVSALW